MSEDKYKDHLFALILAGGGGTRLWPRSRNKTPKQFLKMFGGKTLMQITAKRFSKILPWDRIYVVTVFESYKKEIIKEVPQIHKENIIVEPARRNTGPAHGVGAAFIKDKDADSVIITESADRLVRPASLYATTLLAAAKKAYDEKRLIAIGVKARYPNTGYGHIKRGKRLEGKGKVKMFELDKFVEKPSLPLAKKYTASGKYYWNAGQFVWRADTLLSAIKEHAPKIHSGIEDISKVIGTKTEKQIFKSAYKSMPKISIDYAVVEKNHDFIVVEGGFHWTDIGDWNEVWKNLEKDKDGNVIIDGDEPGGEVMNIDTTGALIHKDGRLIVVLDVDDIIIVDTKDALLVASKNRAQDVKKIVNQLRTQKRKELL